MGRPCNAALALTHPSRVRLQGKRRRHHPSGAPSRLSGATRQTRRVRGRGQSSAMSAGIPARRARVHHRLAAGALPRGAHAHTRRSAACSDHGHHVGMLALAAAVGAAIGSWLCGLTSALFALFRWHWGRSKNAVFGNSEATGQTEGGFPMLQMSRDRHRYSSHSSSSGGRPRRHR